MKKSAKLRQLEGKEKRLLAQANQLRRKIGMLGSASKAQGTRSRAIGAKKASVSAELDRMYYSLQKK